MFLNVITKKNPFQLGNHDNGRIATRYGTQRTDLINILLKTLPGVAVTYYVSIHITQLLT